MYWTACLAAIAVVLRSVDRWYYRDADQVLRLLKLLPRAPGAPISNGRRQLDWLFCWFPFVWVWCDVFAAVSLGASAANPFGWLAIAVFVGGRMRALQEAAHTAVHSGLCRFKHYQWAIANVLAQWPLGRADMHYRYVGHVVKHHRHANTLDHDPNIKRFVALGVVPGMTVAQWQRALWIPFTPTGLVETLRNLVDAIVCRNARPILLPLRIVVVAGFGVLLWTAGGISGITWGFILPLVTIYPFFSWISVLAEHRWYVRCDATDRWTVECINGRPTDYPGAVGWLVKTLVFPFSDRYHLAHSLYPSLRWNYLPAIDRALEKQDSRYGRHRSTGLSSARHARPSALSELCERLTSPGHPEVAEWARTLARPGRRQVPGPIAI